MEKRGRKRQRAFHLLVHPLKGCNGQSLADPKPRARNQDHLLGPHLVAGAQELG